MAFETLSRAFYSASSTFVRTNHAYAQIFSYPARTVNYTRSLLTGTQAQAPQITSAAIPVLSAVAGPAPHTVAANQVSQPGFMRQFILEPTLAGLHLAGQTTLHIASLPVAPVAFALRASINASSTLWDQVFHNRYPTGSIFQANTPQYRELQTQIRKNYETIAKLCSIAFGHSCVIPASYTSTQLSDFKNRLEAINAIHHQGMYIVGEGGLKNFQALEEAIQVLNTLIGQVTQLERVRRNGVTNEDLYYTGKRIASDPIIFALGACIWENVGECFGPSFFPVLSISGLSRSLGGLIGYYGGNTVSVIGGLACGVKVLEHSQSGKGRALALTTAAVPVLLSFAQVNPIALGGAVIASNVFGSAASYFATLAGSYTGMYYCGTSETFPDYVEKMTYSTLTGNTISMVLSATGLPPIATFGLSFWSSSIAYNFDAYSSLVRRTFLTSSINPELANSLAQYADLSIAKSTLSLLSQQSQQLVATRITEMGEDLASSALLPAVSQLIGTTPDDLRHTLAPLNPVRENVISCAAHHLSENHIFGVKQTQTFFAAASSVCGMEQLRQEARALGTAAGYSDEIDGLLLLAQQHLSTLRTMNQAQQAAFTLRGLQSYFHMLRSPQLALWFRAHKQAVIKVMRKCPISSIGQETDAQRECLSRIEETHILFLQHLVEEVIGKKLPQAVYKQFIALTREHVGNCSTTLKSLLLQALPEDIVMLMSEEEHACSTFCFKLVIEGFLLYAVLNLPRTKERLQSSSQPLSQQEIADTIYQTIGVAVDSLFANQATNRSLEAVSYLATSQLH